ncbi:Gfo/Idh/MocA family protein [Butyricicoccus sp. OF10-2]|uniref:Gfo/Idh/MocA family protein n=1 Tax=Butyricicoccus sp. OF10-2 TaxID=2292298 RepID=UPI001FA99E38|nr:Gfo/Idh/MocA family oxidoreductase [Butyricicoccus sp. OF10-2]
MKKLKIGIIGVGRLGYEHACNIANRVPGSELVAIADANFDRAKQVAEELGVTAVYNDPKDLCADPNVEAVAIITNTASHVEMIKIAMDAGKHVSAKSRWLTRLKSARRPRPSSPLTRS